MHLLPDRELFLKSTKVTKILIGEWYHLRAISIHCVWDERKRWSEEEYECKRLINLGVLNAMSSAMIFIPQNSLSILL